MVQQVLFNPPVGINDVRIFLKIFSPIINVYYFSLTHLEEIKSDFIDTEIIKTNPLSFLKEIIMAHLGSEEERVVDFVLHFFERYQDNTKTSTIKMNTVSCKETITLQEYMAIIQELAFFIENVDFGLVFTGELGLMSLKTIDEAYDRILKMGQEEIITDTINNKFALMMLEAMKGKDGTI